MIRVGVIDEDVTLVEAMSRFWGDSVLVERLDQESGCIPGYVDVLIADLASLGGHAHCFLSDVRFQRPNLPIIVTYLYFDATQEVEAEIRALVDLSILKPYDLDHVAKTIHYLFWKSRKSGKGSDGDDPSR